MTQPRYSDIGLYPVGTNAPPATPVVDCQAAADVAMGRRTGLEKSLMVPNMCDPGTHAAPIGLDPGGVDADI